MAGNESPFYKAGAMPPAAFSKALHRSLCYQLNVREHFHDDGYRMNLPPGNPQVVVSDTFFPDHIDNFSHLERISGDKPFVYRQAVLADGTAILDAAFINPTAKDEIVIVAPPSFVEPTSELGKALLAEAGDAELDEVIVYDMSPDHPGILEIPQRNPIVQAMVEYLADTPDY